MPTGPEKKAPATIADLLAIPEPERFHEIFDGELVRKAMPSPRHGRSRAAHDAARGALRPKARGK